MITLSVIAYVIISLLIARYKYWDYQFDYVTGKVSPYYMKGKKSLKYGFSFIPVLLFPISATLFVAIGIVELLSSVVGWMLINMP